VQTQLPPLQMVRPEAADLGDNPEHWEGKVSRNAPCPCGSGLKYKHCHGSVTA
jgi:preprotein translocase subunit SecA